MPIPREYNYILYYITFILYEVLGNGNVGKLAKVVDAGHGDSPSEVAGAGNGGRGRPGELTGASNGGSSRPAQVAGSGYGCSSGEVAGAGNGGRLAEMAGAGNGGGSADGVVNVSKPAERAETGKVGSGRS